MDRFGISLASLVLLNIWVGSVNLHPAAAEGLYQGEKEDLGQKLSNKAIKPLNKPLFEELDLSQTAINADEIL
ncbi:MAG: hypothetical protein ACLFV6_11470, partial [Spirulinaceae cyanobacterium]